MRTVTKDSKLPMTQRNWKVNKKWLRIQPTIWLCTLYPEPGLVLSGMARHCSQTPSFVFLPATAGTKSIWLWPTIIKNNYNKRKLQKLRVYCKNIWMYVCIYLGIFCDNNKILLPCIFWGFYDYVKLLRFDKEFLWHHFWYIYFTLAYYSW